MIKIVGGLSSSLGSTMDFASKAGDMFTKFKNSTMAATIATQAQTIAQGALNFVMNLNPITIVIWL